MELTKQLELLKQLCEIDGVSGGEEKVADWLKKPSAGGLQGAHRCTGQPDLREKGETDPKK